MNKWMRGTLAIAAVAALGGCGVFSGGGSKRTPVLGERVPILTSESETSADGSIADVAVTVPAAVENAAWSQPGGNAAKSMGNLALDFPLEKAWSHKIRGSSERYRLGAAPIVAEGRVYAMDSNGVVHAWQADNGAELWTANTAKGRGNRNARFGGGVSYDGGRLYATNGLGDVVAMEAATGAEVWRQRPGGPLRGAPTIDGNGFLYVLSQGNQLHALKQADGTVAWTTQASVESQGVFGVAAPAAALGTVVVGFSSGELNAYRFENGRSLWGDALSRSTISTAVASLSDIDANPVIDSGRVYAIGQGGRMAAWEITTGTRLWDQPLSSIATPWLADSWLYVVTDDARLMAIARDSGKVRWLVQLRRYQNQKKKRGIVRWTGAVLAGDRLILGNTLGQLVQVSPQDGSVLEQHGGFAALSMPPVVANKMLYVLDNSGKLTAYR